MRVEAIRVDGDRAAQHRDALLGPAEREVRVPRADQRVDRVDAVAERELVGLGGAARVAVRREHVAEQQRRVHVRRLERQHLARRGGRLVTELARRVGARDLEQERSRRARRTSGPWRDRPAAARRSRAEAASPARAR